MDSTDMGYVTMLKSIDLFRGMDLKVMQEMLRDARAEMICFDSGQVIYSRTRYRKSLGILLSGKAEVRKNSAGHNVILNRLAPPKLFGAAILFQDDEEYVSEVTALEPSTILFIPQELLTEYMRRDFTLVENYLAFLSQRIRFLNRKIDSFTQSSAESKLAWYLLDLADGNAAVRFPVSLKNLAQVLNLGRASLYRALDALAEAALIERDGKHILILDKDGLQSLCQ